MSGHKFWLECPTSYEVNVNAGTPGQTRTDLDRLWQTRADQPGLLGIPGILEYQEYLKYLEYLEFRNWCDVFIFSIFCTALPPELYPPSWLSLFKWIESAAWSDLCPLAPHRVIGRGKVVNRVLKYNPQFRFSYPPPTSKLGEMIGKARKNLRAAEKPRLQIDLCDKVWL